ncbi:MAG: nucleotidyltransferase, partial [Mucinivorans sp.]
PNNEAIIDYSVYDAIRGGFGKVVFVIRHSFADQFKASMNKEKFGGQIEVEYVYQELDKLPEGFSVPQGREKPWGTNHALMMGAELIHEPFAVINADDFYGQDAIAVMGSYLSSVAGKKGAYAMVGYEVKKTLSENGTVSRGICTLGRCSLLKSVVERTKIERQGDQIVYIEPDGTFPLQPDTLVSMNLFGFTPDYFAHSEEFFKTFLQANESNLKAEYFIPLLVNELINSGKAKLKVLKTTSDWFGVTYKEDRAATVQRISELIAKGVYPAKLW